ncbi:MAG TPA: deoxyguanosinetriphosphate triphosphohydrolase [Mycobacteriales bacterium]
MTGYAEHDVARWAPEPPKAVTTGRSPFQRDRARVLHAAALRRLAGKTQVVVAGEDDFPRTRLTHSLECAQIGREMGAALGADPDLVDAACLAHDLGHPPFGHNGEQALDEIASAAGGFEGNAQSLRLLTRLEVKVEGAGLNLTRATLDAACKYPWSRRPDSRKFGVYDDDRPVFDWFRGGAGEDRRPIETQVMDWADDVAYSVHDYEDGVHARTIDPASLDVDAIVVAAAGAYLPGLDVDILRAAWTALVAEPWWVRSYDGGPADTAALKRMTSELIGRFCSAAIHATRAVAGVGPLTRYAADLVVPDVVRVQSALLKAVALDLVMREPVRVAQQERQRATLHLLAERLLDRDGTDLDPLLRPAWDAAGTDAGRLRVVVDQIAMLTDASAESLLARIR